MEDVVFAPTVVQKPQPHVKWLSRKTIHLATVIGALLLAAITINALVILATTSGV
jgi:hypothetical protein